MANELVPLHLENMEKDENLTPRARKILEAHAGAIVKSQGTDTREMHDQAFLTLVLADNSTSMNVKVDERGNVTDTNDEDPESNANLVRIAQHNIIEGLLSEGYSDRIYLSTQALNPIIIPRYRGSIETLPALYQEPTTVIDPIHPLTQAVKLDVNNFYTKGQTPLYSRVIDMIGTARYEAQRLIDEWKEPRTTTLIITDGNQYPKRPGGASDVAEVVKGMIETGRHIIAFIGIDDKITDFKSIAKSMGIAEQWILTSANTPAEIAQSIRRFTIATARASRANEREFKLLTAGGFNEIQ